MALPKVNTKDLIKSKLPASTTNTLSVPKPTAELSNVETLNSKNLVGEGNTPLPETIKDQKIAEGVEKNTPGMAACIKEKIKDLAGVFTVPLGIPSFDQFKVPVINDAPNLSVKDAFKATFDDIKNTVKGTVNGIKEAFTFKKQQGLDQIETGGLSLKKFLGCEEMDVDFTPRERKEAVEKPEIITKKEEEGVKKSQVALAAQADENVKQRTQPPIDRSKQELVPALTNVEETNLFTINFVYNIEDFIVKESNREFYFIKDSPEFQSITDYEPYILSRNAKKEVLSNLENQFRTQIESYKSQIIEAKNNNKVPTEEETVSSLAYALDRQINGSVSKVKDLFLTTSVYSNNNQEIEFYSNVYISLYGPTSRKLIGGSIEEESKTVEGIYKNIKNRDYNNLATRVLRILGYDKRKTVGW